MPPMEEAFLTDTALLFAKTGVDAYGQATVDELNPEEIDVRWEHDRREMIDEKGQPVAIDAAVVVKQEVTIGSQMWFGDLSSWYGTGTAGAETEVMDVIAVSRIKDVKGLVSRRTLGLRRHKDDPGS